MAQLGVQPVDYYYVLSQLSRNVADISAVALEHGFGGFKEEFARRSLVRGARVFVPGSREHPPKEGEVLDISEDGGLRVRLEGSALAEQVIYHGELHLDPTISPTNAMVS